MGVCRSVVEVAVTSMIVLVALVVVPATRTCTGPLTAAEGTATVKVVTVAVAAPTSIGPLAPVKITTFPEGLDLFDPVPVRVSVAPCATFVGDTPVNESGSSGYRRCVSHAGCESSGSDVRKNFHAGRVKQFDTVEPDVIGRFNKNKSAVFRKRAGTRCRDQFSQSPRNLQSRTECELRRCRRINRAADQ